MKKLLFSALGAAALLVTGCQKDDTATMGDGGLVSTTIAVSLDDVASTRAINAYGTGAKINRVILEVYTTEGDELYKRIVKEPTSLAAEFDLRLVASQQYNVVAWADYAKMDNIATDATTSEVTGDVDFSYNTQNGLDEVEFQGTYYANDDKRDAFFGNQSVTVDGSATKVDMTLTRPFGQLNVSTKLTDVISSMVPEQVKITYKLVSTKLNAATGSLDATQKSSKECTVDVIESVADATTGLAHLTTDYIFAPLYNEQLIDFTMVFSDKDGTYNDITKEFSNIPIKRNYRTNISGELLTVDGHFDIIMSPGFDGETNVEIEDEKTVDNVSAAQDFLDNCNVTSNINLTIAAIDGTSNTIMVPADITGDVTFNITSATSGSSLSVTADEATDVIVNNDSNEAIDLTVVAEKAHVTVDGIFDELNITCSPTTIEIAEGAVITKLTVNKGNVILYGEAKSIVRGDDNSEIVELTAYGTLGTIGDGIDLIDGTILYNVTQKVQKDDFSDLINYSTDNDIVFVGAGKHYLIANTGYNTGNEGQIQKSVNMYGPNKGVAGTSTERKPEAQIASMVYCAPTDAYKLDIEIDGVEFVEDAGFAIEGGSDIVLKNSIVSSTAVNLGSELDRIFYTNATRMSSNITIENNLFKAADGAALNMRIIGQRFNTSENNYTTYGNCPTVLVMKGNEFHNYNFTMGAYDYISGAESSFTVTGNTFYNDASAELVLDLYDGSGLADAYKYFTVSGNSFNDGQVGINVGFVPENYDPFATSAIETANTFNNVAVNVEIPITFYNMTSDLKYDTFSDLMKYVVNNDEVYVGAGTHESTISSNWKTGVKIYGVNKGVAGNSADRKTEETIIIPNSTSGFGAFYVASNGVASTAIDITYDGVKFQGDSGNNPYFSLEKGDVITILNSVINVTVPDSGTHSGRVIFSQNKYNASNITLKNNLFDPIDEQQQRIVLNSASKNLAYTCNFDSNVFKTTHINAAVYDAGSTYSITNNTFDGASPQAIMTNGSYSLYTITGNTFQNLSTALKSCNGDLDETQQSTFESSNTFDSAVTTKYVKYQ